MLGTIVRAKAHLIERRMDQCAAEMSYLDSHGHSDRYAEYMRDVAQIQANTSVSLAKISERSSNSLARINLEATKYSNDTDVMNTLMHISGAAPAAKPDCYNIEAEILGPNEGGWLFPKRRSMKSKMSVS